MNPVAITAEKALFRALSFLEKKGKPLHSHQKKGSRWLLRQEIIHKHGGLLCDVPGAGKTFQTFATRQSSTFAVFRQTIANLDTN